MYKIDRGGLKSGVYYYDLFLALTTLVMEAGMKKKGEVLRQISTESPEVAKIRKAVQNKDCEPTRDLLGNLYLVEADFAARLIRKQLGNWVLMKKKTGGSMDPKKLAQARLELILAGWQETAAAGEGISSGAIASTSTAKKSGFFGSMFGGKK